LMRRGLEPGLTVALGACRDEKGERAGIEVGDQDRRSGYRVFLDWRCEESDRTALVSAVFAFCEGF